MKRLLSLITIMFLMVTFVACGEPGVKPTEMGEYLITIDTTVDGNTLTISGKTNLPDDSYLAVHVDRLYKCGGETEWNNAGLASHTATVQNGKYSDVAMIYSEKWYDDLSKYFLESGIPPITEVSDDLSITVIFSPVRFPQSDSVYEIVGRNGERLKGEQVESVEDSSTGTFYVLKAITTAYFPFSHK